MTTTLNTINSRPPSFVQRVLATDDSWAPLALILGLLVRPAALALAATMLVAIVTVHLDKGLFMANNGYEFGLALLAISAALVFSGGGRASLDRALSAKRT